MDDYLLSMGYIKKNIPKDSGCLFRAISEQVYGSQVFYKNVRSKASNFILSNSDKFENILDGKSVEDYAKLLRETSSWGTEVEMLALSTVYKKDLMIYTPVEQSPINMTRNNFGEQIEVCTNNWSHYDCLYPLNSFKDSAFIQSLLYETLYKGVFGMYFEFDRHIQSQLDAIIDSSLTCSNQPGFVPNRRNSSGERFSNGEKCHESSSPDLNGKISNDVYSYIAVRRENLLKKYAKNAPISLKILKSLDPYIFRNVAYDSWFESKKDEQKISLTAMVSFQYSPGDICLVKLSKGDIDGTFAKNEKSHKDCCHFYDAHIQHIKTGDKVVTIFVEELGKKFDVKVDQLFPFPLHLGILTANANYVYNNKWRCTGPAAGFSLPQPLHNLNSHNPLLKNIRNSNLYNHNKRLCKRVGKHARYFNHHTLDNNNSSHHRHNYSGFSNLPCVNQQTYEESNTNNQAFNKFYDNNAVGLEYDYSTNGQLPIENITDDTKGFTTHAGDDNEGLSTNTCQGKKVKFECEHKTTNYGNILASSIYTHPANSVEENQFEKFKDYSGVYSMSKLSLADYQVGIGMESENTLISRNIPAAPIPSVIPFPTNLVSPSQSQSIVNSNSHMLNSTNDYYLPPLNDLNMTPLCIPFTTSNFGSSSNQEVYFHSRELTIKPSEGNVAINGGGEDSRGFKHVNEANYNPIYLPVPPPGTAWVPLVLLYNNNQMNQNISQITLSEYNNNNATSFNNNGATFKPERITSRNISGDVRENGIS